MEYNMTNLKEFTRDYISRTMANYNTINNLKESGDKNDSNEVFDVTQLINSLFGILIMPFESIKALKGNTDANSFRDVNKKMKEADEVAFNDLSAVISELKADKCFYDSYLKDFEDGIEEITFVYRLRNSLAHSGNSGLRFFPISENDQRVSEISSIIFCDEEKSGKGDSFIAELTVEQVKRVIASLSEIFSKYSEFEGYYEYDDYEKTIQSMRGKMEGIYKASFEYSIDDKKEVDGKFKRNLKSERLDNAKIIGHTLVLDELEFLTWIFRSNGRFKLLGPERAFKSMEQLSTIALNKDRHGG